MPWKQIIQKTLLAGPEDMFVLCLKQINRMRTKSTNLVITDDKSQEKFVALHV